MSGLLMRAEGRRSESVLRVPNPEGRYTGFRVQGFGFGFIGFRVLVLGFWVWLAGFGFWIWF